MCNGQLNCSQKCIKLERQHTNSSAVELLFVFLSPDVYFHPSQKKRENRYSSSTSQGGFSDEIQDFRSHHFLSSVIISLAFVDTSVKTLLSKCLEQMSVGVASQAKSSE